MAIMTHYEPWAWVNQFQKELEKARSIETTQDSSGVATAEWAPAVDIKEEEERFILQADLPGIQPEDIDITMEKGVLTINGQRNTEAKTEHDGYKRMERAYGSFYRRFSLPDTADADHISASSHHGVLEIDIPKKPALQPKKITVAS